MAWRFELATDIGGRAEQQDRADVLAVPDRPDDYLVVLADGMGGQQHGAEAAQAVIDTARRQFEHAPIINPKRFLTDLCRSAHKAIERVGRKRQTNPGSTCAFLYATGSEAYWAHVGDSRLYHFAADRLLSRTRDHTVAELRKGDHGFRPAARLDKLEDRQLYMCLGGQNELVPEFGATAVGDNDWFMLCSDGFWSQVEANEAARELLMSSSNQRIANDLAALASQRGGPGGDNVSLVLAIHHYQPQKSVWRRFLPSGVLSKS